MTAALLLSHGTPLIHSGPRMEKLAVRKLGAVGEGVNTLATSIEYSLNARNFQRRRIYPESHWQERYYASDAMMLHNMSRNKVRVPGEACTANMERTSSSLYCSSSCSRSIIIKRSNSRRSLIATIYPLVYQCPHITRSRKSGLYGKLQSARSENVTTEDLEYESSNAPTERTDNSQSTDSPKLLTKVETQAEVVLPAQKGAVLPWWKTLPKRWSIVLLCFFAFLLCNMDRVNMSIAILPMSAEYHWNPTTIGLVQSSFFWGYLLTQIAGGIWADSIGGKQVLGFGVVWWSLSTIATPLAAKLGLPVLLFVRACMGVGEGVAMPAMNNLLSKWVPVQERSRSLAFVYSGMYLGSVLGLAFSPSLIHKFNWPSVFFSFGSLGAIWFAAWQRTAYSSPVEDPDISEEEKQLIMGGAQPKKTVENIPWKLLLSKAPVWALIICHFCHNWGTFILLTWMPTYYNQVLGFNLMESGMFSVLPWLTMAISANLGGWIADTLVSLGVSITTVRKVMQSIGFLGPAFFLTQLSHVRSPALAVLCMMGSQGADAFSQSGLYSNHQDIGPRYAGVLLGLSNTAGVLAGVFGTAATGYILQHGSWDDVFKVAVGLYLFGTVIWNIFSSGERIFD
ncbi:hypothetical protein O6H91_18G050400 [Diphasiastrum complanatum]|uniref:Uncharacterized protein n=16 Tax=Diphasiastrum complanatum TaxID=34168 RepID=A0ACC2B0Z7_DIPCM|nr:hypothetical protein O6H91_18G050400 [Diphasiastrum complanatum]KAJ7523417.1 hypothetical protein O6H91_18G050400 [Diphasiastrum complanatum]KAJ7523418.1 hypothetical protein O6H91_18G050400 [Diphasiastrum complanatum]KAJ7523419.1 hypothetical protein O6H91_18G050400 [Diphasiastrum complanatum]KAJ7523420.1 hypothetical protein O6H91_18G050400 [Diphasiastrum complanatum]